MKKFSKKTIVLAAAVLVALAGLVAGAVFLAKLKPRFITPERAGFRETETVELAAAHGLSVLAPANSSPAFALAGRNGYRGLQFEVRRAADGIWVVMQEKTINDATNGSGQVSKMTYKQLLRCRINKGHRKTQYTEDELMIPTLEQALLICSQYGMTPVIEVRQSGVDCVEELLSFVGSGRKKQYVFIFAEDEQLSRAKELLENKSLGIKQENVLLCRIVEKLNAKTLAKAKETPDIAVYFPAKENKNAKKIQMFTDAGLTLYAGGVNKPKQAAALYNAGVRRFTTDKLAYQEILTEKERVTARSTTRPTTSPAKANELPSRAKRPSTTAKATTKAAKATKKAQ